MKQVSPKIWALWKLEILPRWRNTALPIGRERTIPSFTAPGYPFATNESSTCSVLLAFDHIGLVCLFAVPTPAFTTEPFPWSCQCVNSSCGPSRAMLSSSSCVESLLGFWSLNLDTLLFPASAPHSFFLSSESPKLGHAPLSFQPLTPTWLHQGQASSCPEISALPHSPTWPSTLWPLLLESLELEHQRCFHDF